MSVSVALPATTALDWKPVSLVFTYKNIFRTPAIKVAAEVVTLLAVFAGIFSLFLGLSVI